MNSKIYLSSPHLCGREQEYVQEALDTNWVAPLGPNVNGFEADLQDYNNIPHAAALSSGTAAIHLALVILGVKSGDEVICSTFTFSASANAIVYQNAVPIFVDSERDTWNMCPSLCEEAIIDRINKGKKPKAILLVHLYGMPSKIHDFIALSKKYDIPLIEDSAEAIGASVNGQKMGTFGEFGVYSFNGNKIITTSGGGALVSKDKQKIDKARFLATQARDDAPHFQHSHIGYNYRMSNIVAGIGRGQMTVLDKWVDLRRNINQWYRTLLKDIDFISFQDELDGFFSNYWLTTIYVGSNSHKIDREVIRLHLLEDNIESRPLWKPMHLQPIFKSNPSYLNGVSDDLFKFGLCLPSSSNLTIEQKTRISSKLMSIFNE